MLIDEVNIIFHMAAVVKFDAPLKSTVLSNVRGTREVLNLAKACRYLNSFVYVSTAYSHATRTRIGTIITEEFQESPVEPTVLINLAETLDEKKFINITPGQVFTSFILVFCKTITKKKTYFLEVPIYTSEMMTVWRRC